MSRSLRARLALLVALIAAAAVAVAFLVLVPQLQTRLENQRLAQLERVAPTFTYVVRGAIAKEIKAPKLDALVRSLADRSDQRRAERMRKLEMRADERNGRKKEAHLQRQCRYASGKSRRGRYR